jgi:hypothetical protein
MHGQQNAKKNELNVSVNAVVAIIRLGTILSEKLYKYDKTQNNV